MQYAWRTIYGPLMELRKPKVVVEVGAFLGANTRVILDYCRRHDAVLHVIDPLSQDPALRANQEAVFGGLARENPRHLVFHRGTSLPLLEQIGAYDAVLLDGDHNWYVVMEELRAIERVARAHGKVPMIFLDDIAWPHGRRDCYFAPDLIPAAYRHPYRKAGVVPGRSDLLDDGALFAGFFHAEHEGGPRNGILTAVEDFLKETALDLDFVEVPLKSGLAALLPKDDGPTAPAMRRWIADWTFNETLKAALREMSAEHIAMVNVLSPMSAEIDRLRKREAEGWR